MDNDCSSPDVKREATDNLVRGQLLSKLQKIQKVLFEEIDLDKIDEEFIPEEVHEEL
jgi:hypothetical protein